MEEKKKIFVVADNIINSLGFTTSEVAASVEKNITGFSVCDDRKLTPVPVPLSRVNDEKLEQRFAEISNDHSFTRMEKMLICSIDDAIKNCSFDLKGDDTLLIISTTKGNIDLLEEGKKDNFPQERVYLWKMAEVVGKFFNLKKKPVVVSNACISGVLALGMAFHYIKSGKYKNVIVSGGDMATEFVISGFLSFQALSNEPCKPFDSGRTGLSLGEGAATMILSSTRPDDQTPIMISGSAITNDANHISGPSRTGEELALAINRSIEEAGIKPEEIGFVSAHGTATLYNDEMESKALTIAGLHDVPVNSFKGYWGHTLGAAGVIESVMTVYSMRKNILFKSPGFRETGTPHSLNIITENKKVNFSKTLKIASGFGGCNGAVIFGKEINQ